MEKINTKLLVSVEEAARCLDLSINTVYNELSKARRGKPTFLKVKPVKVGGKLLKFRVSDLQRYVDGLPED
ncbi:MAG TPA: helix-turn-helix domain-containing protein [Desulfatiglandales bacterium]|nr:helix-turn-helix domain-containing protein [Desulfatiglandales bacterium]